MIDGQGRIIDYLRISVTDRCNLRCVYCMPEEGMKPVSHDEILRYQEIERLARIFARLGIRKIKITGGEPLVRKGIENLVKNLKRTPGIEQVTITTNGILLGEKLEVLKAAGAGWNESESGHPESENLSADYKAGRLGKGSGGNQKDLRGWTDSS